MMTMTITPALTSPARCASVAPSPTRHTRRCLTLLEILIALALILGLAALGLPMMLNRLDERAFEAAADTASEQLMMARAHAQATGEAIEVTYSPSTGQVRARVYAPWSSEMDTDLAAIEPGTSPLLDASLQRAGSTASRDGAGSWMNGPPNRDRGRAAADDGASGGVGVAIAEPWASRALGQGISIARRPSSLFPFDGATGQAIDDHRDKWMSASDGRDDDAETLEDLERGQEVRLAVFMPDGSALVGDDLFLNDDSGRCGRISINPWSGLPRFQRMVSASAAAGVAETEATEDDATPDRDAFTNDGASTSDAAADPDDEDDDDAWWRDTGDDD
jgi:type II secretory pathway pseudopilin PulG